MRIGKNMDYHDLIEKVIQQLDEKADPDRLERAKTNYPTAMTIKGVPVPKLRPIIKELTARFKKEPAQDLIRFVKQLKATRILEAQQIAFELLEKNKTARRELTLEEILELGQGMDNWILVDFFSGYIAGPAWREGRISDEVVKDWAVSEDKWWRRAAVVSTVALNQKARGGDGDPQRTLMICQLVAQDRDDMVIKALSWALRELAKRDAQPVADFITQNEDILAKRVLREVRTKLETGKKN